MSLSDPLGDMLARIKNGQLRKKESVLMPASRFRGNVLDVLHREGYIRGFKKVEIILDAYDKRTLENYNSSPNIQNIVLKAQKWQLDFSKGSFSLPPLPLELV